PAVSPSRNVPGPEVNPRPGSTNTPSLARASDGDRVEGELEEAEVGGVACSRGGGGGSSSCGFCPGCPFGVAPISTSLRLSSRRLPGSGTALHAKEPITNAAQTRLAKVLIRRPPIPCAPRGILSGRPLAAREDLMIATSGQEAFAQNGAALWPTRHARYVPDRRQGRAILDA